MGESKVDGGKNLLTLEEIQQGYTNFDGSVLCDPIKHAENQQRWC